MSRAQPSGLEAPSEGAATDEPGGPKRTAKGATLCKRNNPMAHGELLRAPQASDEPSGDAMSELQPGMRVRRTHASDPPAATQTSRLPPRARDRFSGCNLVSIEAGENAVLAQIARP